MTFLALARKAGSIRKHGSIGSWLHGTAHRVALKARTAGRRRQVRESRVAEVVVASESQPPVEDRELSPILHEEIERLPAKYRAPIVLCYLEGITQDQAAIELGWPAGTVRGRLARARELLRSRLTRRGLAVSAGLVASGSTADAASAGLSAALIEATVRAALGTAAAGILTRTAMLLLKTVLREMALTRFVQLVAPLVMIALMASGAAMVLYPGRTKLSGERTSIVKIAPVRPPAPTDLAGDPLPDGALARLGTTRFLHESHVNHVTYSPDGATLASFDGAVHLWDPATGRERRRIETGAFRGLGRAPFAYAPDGRLLAIPGDSRTGLYDATTGRQVRPLEGEWPTECHAFSPDGRLLAGGIRSGEKAGITLWDVASGRVIRRMGGPSWGTMAVAFPREGHVLISCVSWSPELARRARRIPQPEESAIILWEVATGEEIRRIGLGKMRIDQAVLTADGKTLATTTTDPSIRLWDLATGRELRRFGGGDVDPAHFAFSPDGTRLAFTENRDNFTDIAKLPPVTTPIHLWDTATGRELRHWETEYPSHVCFAPDGKTLASGGQVIRLWDVSTGREIRPQTGHHSEIEDAAFTPDGRSILTVGHDRTIRFWEPATGKAIRQLEGNDSDLRCAGLSADGKTLAAGGGFQPTRLWDVASGREVRRFQIPGKIDDRYVECADLSPDGKTLATSLHNGVMFWDTATGARRAGAVQFRIPFTNVSALVKALRFAPDGQSVATIGGDWVRIWNVATATETRLITMPNVPPRPPGGRRWPTLDDVTSAAHLAFSPDGKILAVSSQRDGQICLLDSASGQELGRLDGRTGYRTKAFAFSPDGRILATGIETGKMIGRELSIRLWDVAARREIGRVPAHRADITALAFSPDGRRLVSASGVTALVWDVAAIVGRRPAAAEPRDTMVRKD